jgi:uncharacterized delta-60 repeat protein
MFYTRWLHNLKSAWYFNSRSGNGRRLPRSRPAAGFRPQLESLEDRCLLSGGVLDPTFGTGGLVTTNLGTQNESFDYAVAVYHNQGAANEGKIVAAGPFKVSFRNQDIGVVRYNLDGSLDKSFAGSGQVTTSFGTDKDGAHDVKIQPDGKVVVAGWTGGAGSDFAVVRYNADGSLDTSFGSRGLAITDINHSGDFAWNMVLQPDGKIVLAGTTIPKNTSNVDLAVVRYNADGSLDTSFGTGGKVTRHFAYPLAAIDHGGMDMAIDSTSNKVVIVAQLTQGPNVVVRLNTNGSPDASFGSNGAGYVSILQSTPSVAIQTDGHIVVTGSNAELARFNSDGTLDASFGSGGTVVTVLPNNVFDVIPRAMTIQPDGRIVVAGVEDTTSNARQFMVARYNPNGSQDSTFGVGGIAGETVVGVRNDQMDVALEPDGRIVVAGPGVLGGGTNFALVRFLAAGPQIGSFTASPNPVTAGSNVTLTVSNIVDGNPNSTITQVAFYADSNGDGKLESGTDTLLGFGTQTSTGVWTFTFSTATAGLTFGSYTLFAQAEDSYGVLSDPFAITATVI